MCYIINCLYRKFGEKLSMCFNGPSGLIILFSLIKCSWMIVSEVRKLPQIVSHAGCVLHIASPWVQIITYLSQCFHTAACQSVLPPPAQIGAVWKQLLPMPCGSNWLGLKKPLYQWSWSESWAAELQAAHTFLSCWETDTAAPSCCSSLTFTHSTADGKNSVYEMDTMTCIWECIYYHSRMMYLVLGDSFMAQ